MTGLSVLRPTREYGPWTKETTKCIDMISNVMQQLSGPGKGTLTASKMTDGPHVSPLGGHTTIKYVKGDQRNDDERDPAATGTRQANLEAACPGLNHGTLQLSNEVQHRRTWRRHVQALTTGHYSCPMRYKAGELGGGMSRP